MKREPEQEIHRWTTRRRKNCAPFCPLMRIKCHFLYWIYCCENDLRSCVSAAHIFNNGKCSYCLWIYRTQAKWQKHRIDTMQQQKNYNSVIIYDGHTTLHLLPHSKLINYNSTAICLWMENNNKKQTKNVCVTQIRGHSTMDHIFFRPAHSHCFWQLLGEFLREKRNPQFYNRQFEISSF